MRLSVATTNEPPGCDEARAGGGEGVEIRHVLDDLERQHGVEALAVGGQGLRRGVAVVDGEPLLPGVEPGCAGTFGLRRVDGDHVGAEPA